MALQSFLFGGNTQETPESIKRKRDIARALLSARAPQNVGEGISALGDGIVSAVLNSRADKAEKTGLESASNDFAPLIGGFGASPATPGATGSSMPKVDASGNVAATPTNSALPGSFLAAVDRTEGAGNYDTLFGHSQKNGPFAGTAVSQMPIKDVLAFTDPSGPYAQYVKGKVGRVATPVGKYQTVGTTLRGAVDALGLDPNLPYDQGTQDRVASYLARNRIASADTLPGKIKALRSEWEGFKNVPDSEMAQIVADLQSAPAAGTEVASLDPSVGMPSVSPIEPPPVNAPAPPPTPGYVDPRISTEGRAPAPLPVPAQAPQPSPAVAQALMAPQKGGRVGGPMPLPDAEFNARFGSDDTGAIPPQIAPQSALPPLPVSTIGPAPTVAGVPPVAEAPPQPNPQVAQALLRHDRSGVGIGGDAPGAGYFPAAPGTQAQGPSQQQIMRVLTNPYATESQKAVANALLQRQMDASDPDSQLDREYKRAQLEALKAKPTNKWQKLSDTSLFNEEGEVKDISPTGPGGQKQFRFAGNSVEAQSLNGLIDSGQITPEQAQQLGAGKTITGPNNEIIFMTPQGVFGQKAGQQAQPLSTPDAALPAGSPAAAAPGNGNIQITEPKVTIDEKKAMTFADRLSTSGAIINKLGKVGTDKSEVMKSQVPFGVGNMLVSEDFQKLDQARRDFINAQLRRESGAVISTEEFDNANKQYFPQPGDSDDVIKQKEANRKIAIDGMARDSGPTYKPPEIQTDEGWSEIAPGVRVRKVN